MPFYHTSAREQCHDSTPYLLLAGHGGTPVALHHAAPRLAKPRRGVTSTIGSTCALQEQAQTRQRTHILQGPDAETSLCRVCPSLEGLDHGIGHPTPFSPSLLLVAED